MVQKMRESAWAAGRESGEGLGGSGGAIDLTAGGRRSGSSPLGSMRSDS